MPLFKVDGLDDLMKTIEKAGQLNNDQLMNEMLNEGGKVVEEEWVKEIRSLDLISPGPITKKNMIANVKGSRPKKNKHGLIKYIYPMGEEKRDRGNVRHAAKAFYQHYGYFNVLTGKRVPGKFFVDKIEKRAENRAVQIMQKIFEDYMNSIQK